MITSIEAINSTPSENTVKNSHHMVGSSSLPEFQNLTTGDQYPDRILSDYENELFMLDFPRIEFEKKLKEVGKSSELASAGVGEFRQSQSSAGHSHILCYRNNGQKDNTSSNGEFFICVSNIVNRFCCVTQFMFNIFFL